MLKKMSEHWIRVNTSEGMFSSESGITLVLASGQDVSFFADNSLVKKENGDSFLKVTLVNKSLQGDKELVLLPTEPFETSSRWAEVKK